MKKGKIDLGLSGYESLFMTDQERQEASLPKVYELPLSEIDPFPEHPFKVRMDEDMDQLTQSVKERGVITPITVRQKEDGRYEIVSGHNRVEACQRAGRLHIRECGGSSVHIKKFFIARLQFTVYKSLCGINDCLQHKCSNIRD